MTATGTAELVARTRARISGRGSGEEGLRRLRAVALFVPVMFLVAVLALRGTVVTMLPGHNGHLIIDAVLLLGTIVFSVTLFSAIDASHRRLESENRDLAAVESLVSAVRQARTVADVAETSLAVIRRSTGADRVVVEATWAEPERREEVWASGDAVADGSVVAVPLMSGPDIVGSLTVTAPDPRLGPSPQAYAEMGRVVGSGLHRARYTALLQEECQRATAAERRRITREMHDSLAQVLGVTHFRLAALAEDPQVARSPQVRGEIEDIATMCADAYGDVREAIQGIREGTRQDRTFVEAVASYVESFSRRTGIETVFTAPEESLPLSEHARAQALRVVQEALTNVRKHSGATAAIVSVRADHDRFRVVVEDDGHGFDPGQVHDSRFGLSTMHERARLIDGALHVESSPGDGTRVELVGPVHTRIPA